MSREYYDKENDDLARYQREKRLMKDFYFPRNAVIFQKLWLFAMKKPVYIPVRDRSQYRGLMTRLTKCLKPILNDKRIRWARQNLKMSLVEYQGRPCLRLGYDETLMEVKRLLSDLYREHDLDAKKNPASPYEEITRIYENDFMPNAESNDELEDEANKRMAKERREFYRVLGIVEKGDYQDPDEEVADWLNSDTLRTDIVDEDDLLQLEKNIPTAYMEDMLEQEALASGKKEPTQ